MYKFFTSKKLWALVTISIALALFLLFIFPFLTAGKKIFVRILLSPVRLYSSVAGYFQDKGELFDDNKILRKKIADLSLEIEQFEGLRSENGRLRDLLGFKDKVSFETIPAEIVARNPNDWVGSFLIDKGFADGVPPGAAVCSASGLLGKVVITGRDLSSVMQVTHPNFKAGGVIRDTQINGILVGSGRDRVKMMYLPVDAEIKEGQMVLTSGFSRIFPRSIPIGRIIAVGRSKTGLYQYAMIKPAASAFDQEEVLCVK